MHTHNLAPVGHAAERWVFRRSGSGGQPTLVASTDGPDMIHVPVGSSVGRRACVAAMAAADLVMANSTWAARRCEEIAGRPLPVRVVYLGADVPPLAHDGNGAVRMVTVAHLVARKRHEVVLRALAALDPARRPSALALGDGPCRPGLERLAAELGVADRVRFLGQLPNPEAVAQAAACDLFVMPGVEEPFGVAFVEAMAAGLPAIGSRGEGGPR